MNEFMNNDGQDEEYEYYTDNEANGNNYSSNIVNQSPNSNRSNCYRPTPYDD